MKAVRFTFALLLVLGIHGAYNDYDKTCNALVNDRDRCQSSNWPEEYDCVRKQNSLKSIMDCVTPIAPGGEYYTCTDPENDERYGHLETYQVDREYCLLPRNVIIRGSLVPKCRICSIAGALDLCPLEDANFHLCLCENNVSRAAFECLAECFLKSGLPDQLSCDVVRRAVAPAAVEGPPAGSSYLSPQLTVSPSVPRCFLVSHINNGPLAPDLPPPCPTSKVNSPKSAADVIWLTRLNQDGEYSFYINQYGKPVYYPFGSANVGMQLPYYDEFILNGKGKARCYVYPFSRNTFCYRWLLATPVALPPARTSARPNWNYGSQQGDANPTAPITKNPDLIPKTTEVVNILTPKKTPTVSNTVSRGKATVGGASGAKATGKVTALPTGPQDVPKASGEAPSGKAPANSDKGSKSAADSNLVPLSLAVGMQLLMLVW